MTQAFGSDGDRISFDERAGTANHLERGVPATTNGHKEAVEKTSCPPTRNTLIELACDHDPEIARPALREICAYYEEVFKTLSFRMAKKWGLRDEDARELPGGFVEYLLDRPTLKYERRPGKKFRDFLRTLFWNYTVSGLRKKGLFGPGSRPTISLDEATLANASPEDIAFFDRQYALALHHAVLTKLERDCQSKTQLFQELKRKLTGKADEEFYKETASKLGMGKEEKARIAVKVALHRMRRRYGELFVEEVAQTVAPEDIKDEIRHLFRALGSNYGTSIV
jgi:RNA polymerase sigma-70 factor (ECF subfamily)